VLLDCYWTLVDLSEPVRSCGFDDFARRLGLPLGPGELYRRYAEMIRSESAEDAGPGFVPYRVSWLAAGRRLLAPFGRESAAGQFAGAYADLHARAVIFPEVPGAVRALARHARTAVVANADHDYLMRCLNHNGLRFEVVVDSESARCYKPDPQIFQRTSDALSVPASEAAMVGDTPETDVQGGHRAGLRAVWLNRDHRDWPANLAPPEAVIDELGQLLRRLRAQTRSIPMAPGNRAGSAETGKLIPTSSISPAHALGVLAADAPAPLRAVMARTPWQTSARSPRNPCH
jgi:2-haloalkanoic acid dehalogenase type II